MKKLYKNNTSGYAGVYKTKQHTCRPWKASIRVEKEFIHLGMFATMEEAVAARKAAELQYKKSWR